MERIDQRSHWDEAHEKAKNSVQEPSDFARLGLRILELEKSQRVLELGCGRGRDSLFLAMNRIEICACDYSRSALEVLRQKARQLRIMDRLMISRLDARLGLPYRNESFDGLYSHMFYNMEFTPEELQLLLHESKRVLRKGACNIFSVRSVSDDCFGRGLKISEDMYQVNAYTIRFFTPDRIRDLARGWVVESLVESEERSETPVRRLLEVVLRRTS